MASVKKGRGRKIFAQMKLLMTRAPGMSFWLASMIRSARTTSVAAYHGLNLVPAKGIDSLIGRCRRWLLLDAPCSHFPRAWFQKFGGIWRSMFGQLGLPELLVLLAIVFLLFGAKRLPEIARL